MPKNIVIFSDGTGQEGGKGTNSNVYHMFNMIEDRTPGQIAFYDAGVGTGWRKVTGNIAGMGISRNIRQAYKFIFENFQSGDCIYLVGFSRGATTVRSLSNFIHHFGILPRSRPELIKKAYRIYKRSDKDDIKRRAGAFVNKHHTMWTKIEFIGCYDTVTALGLPFKSASAVLDGIRWFRHKFHDLKLSPSVKHAYHALAIDDERITFHPELWETEVKDYQTIHQVWFAGMHTDVGGGYEEHGLSDIALVWLTGKAVGHGLRIHPYEVEIVENSRDVMHDSRRKLWQKVFYWHERRSWDPKRTDTPVVHQSVLDRVDASTSLPSGKRYEPWILDPDVDYDPEPWLLHEDQPWYCPKGSEEARVQLKALEHCDAPETDPVD